MVEVILNMVTTNKLIRIMIIILFSIFLWRLSYYILGSDETNPLATISTNTLSNFEAADDRSDSIKVAVYYEALCPDSSYYVRRQLLPTFQKLKDYIRVELVPFGKAQQEKLPDGSYKFRCQHNVEECDCNKMHACVALKVSNSTLSLSIISCMIGLNMRDGAIEAAKQCMRLHHELYYNHVEKCYLSVEGDELLWQMGIKTQALRPEATFIPTITIDGSQDDQNMIFKNTTNKLCSLLRVKHPTACGA